MIIGGSQGARIFNKNFHQVIFELSKKVKLKVIHQTDVKNINFLKIFTINIRSKIKFLVLIIIFLS